MHNTAFLPHVSDSILTYYENLILPYMPEHYERWVGRPGLSAWNSRLSSMHDYCNNRPAIALQHIKNAFSITNKHNLQVNVSDVNRGFIRINSIDINSKTHGISNPVYPWDGVYFEGVPVTISATALPGFRFIEWQGDIISSNPNLTVNLTQDLNLIAVFEGCDQELLHYWHFNDLANGEISSVNADSSIISGAVITYEGSGNGYMDRTNGSEGSDINTQNNTPSGRALRVRNPSDTRYLLLKIPTTNYSEITCNFACMRTNNGATEQSFFYRTSPTDDWKAIEENYTITDQFELFSFIIDNKNAFDNELLELKIEFLGPNANGSSGNNRFDNITIWGSTFSKQNIDGKICPGAYFVFGTDTLTEPGVYNNYPSCDIQEELNLSFTDLDTSITLTSISFVANQDNATYAWIDCETNTVISGANSQTFTPSSEGEFAAQITFEGCAYTSSCISTTLLGSKTLEKNNISVYPNPTADYLNIESDIDQNKLNKVLVFDIKGKLLFEQNLMGETRNTIDLSSLKDGLYIVQILGLDQNEVFKILKTP